jgi:hypothetical protein
MRLFFLSLTMLCTVSMAQNATQRLQNQINATPKGGTLLIRAGTYNLDGTLKLLSDRHYKGQPGTVLHTPGGFIFATPYDNAQNITISGFTLDGGGIILDGSGSVPADHITITGNTIENIHTISDNWTLQNGIFIASGLRNGSIDHNSFINIIAGEVKPDESAKGGGITAYGLDHTSVVYNTFHKVVEGMHIMFSQPFPSSAVVISNNQGTQIHRIPIEIQQGNNTGLTVANNVFSDFLVPYYSTFGLSIVPDGATGVSIIGNTILGPPPPSDPRAHYGMGLEVSGIGTVVRDNRIEGDWHPGIGIGSGPGAIVTSNVACGSEAGKAIGPYLTPPPANVTIKNNIQAVTCP